MLGITTFNSTSYPDIGAGVLGIDESANSTTNAGVVGRSQKGFGVIADIQRPNFSCTGNAALAAFSNGSGVTLAPADIVDGQYLGTGVIADGTTGLVGMGLIF